MAGATRVRQLVRFLRVRGRNSDQTENILQAAFLKVKSKDMEFTNLVMGLFILESSTRTLWRGSGYLNFLMATVLRANL